MKINKKLVSKMIRESIRHNVYNLSEVVAYSPGMKDLQKVDYPECKIEIPPIFKKAFLENKGADANTVRAIMGKEFGQLSQTQTGSSEKVIAVIESVFSDANINNITSIVSKIASVGGVPAVYCVVLQKAIDAFAALVDVYHEKVDTEEDRKEPAFIKIITDYLAANSKAICEDLANPTVPAKFAAVAKEDTSLGTSPFKAPIVMLYFGDYLNELGNDEISGKDSPVSQLPATIGLAPTKIDVDTDLAKKLRESYQDFIRNRKNITDYDANADGAKASDYISRFFMYVLKQGEDGAPSEIRSSVIEKMNEYEKTLNQQQITRYRAEIKQKMTRLSNSFYANCFNFVTDQLVQDYFSVLDKKFFYSNTKNLYGSAIIPIAQRLN